MVITPVKRMLRVFLATSRTPISFGCPLWSQKWGTRQKHPNPLTWSSHGRLCQKNFARRLCTRSFGHGTHYGRRKEESAIKYEYLLILFAGRMQFDRYKPGCRGFAYENQYTFEGRIVGVDEFSEFEPAVAIIE